MSRLSRSWSPSTSRSEHSGRLLLSNEMITTFRYTLLVLIFGRQDDGYFGLAFKRFRILLTIYHITRYIVRSPLPLHFQGCQSGGFTQYYWTFLWCSGVGAHWSANQLFRLDVVTLALHAVGRETSKGRILQSSLCRQKILSLPVLGTESRASVVFRPRACRGSIRASQAESESDGL